MPKFPLRNLMVVGAETEIGQLCCRLFSHLGYDVLATAPEPISALNVPQLLLDVCDEESVASAFRLAVETFGPFGILINVSGLDSVEKVYKSLPEMQAQLEKRFFATIGICKRMLPYMRKSGGGLIVQAGGLAPVPKEPELVSIYQAVQFSISGITHQLNAEIRKYNVQIVDLEEAHPHRVKSAKEWSLRDCWAPEMHAGSFAAILSRLKLNETQDTLSEMEILRAIAETIRQHDPNAYDARLGRLNRFSPPHLGLTLDAFQQASNKSVANQDEYVKCKLN
ncbi:MAG: SDR family NAD(P)-dependent oxidoreductase [Bacteroidota bacterium]